MHCAYTTIAYLLQLEVPVLATAWRYAVTIVILWALLRLVATRWQV